MVCAGPGAPMRPRLTELSESAAIFPRARLRPPSTILMAKVQVVEMDLKVMQSEVSHHAAFVPAAADTMMLLENRVEHLENLRRAHVVRLVGLPKAVGDGDLVTVVTEICGNLFEGDSSGDIPKVVRAIRLPSGKSARVDSIVGGTVLIHLADSAQRDLLLHRAAIKKVVEFEKSRILMFPDISPLTQQRRKRMAEIRKELINLDLTASAWHPAKLRVFRNGKVFIFAKVDSAETFLTQIRDSAKSALPS